ncbi:Predicted arabinose efflux permease, MFS family [Azospirillum oryzae]|uniref:Predicted arabinose efflux permease, MFS family n=1 Tax=Azospirillum oryzae TaxID=286727 RepID=A0A1X7HDU0_9PROT|nr:YbfB/YjiJ family MFS transporter [Azospirillum oryzae]SMF84184.1 Predicted arabinose efflux permease, MFS family [Azospirillum oryzae]
MVRVLVGGLIGLAIAMGVARFAFTPILPAMQDATGLRADGAGLLASLNYLGYFIGALGAGLVPHGATRTAVFRLSLLVSVATTAAMGLDLGDAGQAMPAWLVLRFLSGVSSAGIFILGIAMVLDTLTRGGGERLAGWLYTGIGVGIASSGLFVALFGGRLGWDGDWLALGAICAVLGLMPGLWVRDPAPQHHARAAKAEGAAPARAGGLSAPLLLLTLAYFLEGGGYIVSATFLVSILKTDPGTAAVGEAAWMVVGIGAMGAGVFWAAVARRTNSWWSLILAHLTQTVAILLPMTGSPTASVVSALLFGGTFVGIVSQAFALGRQLSGGASARVVGALTAAYGLGQIIGPLPAGLVVTRTGSFNAALLGAAAAVVLGTLLLVLGMVIAGRQSPAGSAYASPKAS